MRQKDDECVSLSSDRTGTWDCRIYSNYLPKPPLLLGSPSREMTDGTTRSRRPKMHRPDQPASGCPTYLGIRFENCFGDGLGKHSRKRFHPCIFTREFSAPDPLLQFGGWPNSEDRETFRGKSRWEKRKPHSLAVVRLLFRGKRQNPPKIRGPNRIPREVVLVDKSRRCGVSEEAQRCG